MIFEYIIYEMCVQTAVGPDNVAGYDAVQQLAHFLVSLAGEAYITNEQSRHHHRDVAGARSI